MRHSLIYVVLLGTLGLSTSFADSVTTTKTCEVRALPSATTRSRAKLAAGTEVELLGLTKRQAHLHIQMSNGIQGWITSSCVGPQPTPVSARATAPTNLSL